MIHALAHTLGILAFAALIWATGSLLQQLIRPLRSWHGGTGLLRLVLGCLGWVALMFLLGVMQWFEAPVIMGAALLLVAAGTVVTARSHHPHLGWPEPKVVALLAAPGMLLFALFLNSLTPGVGWDDSAYHLTVPRLWLEHGGFRRVPLNLYSNWPLSVELLYGLAMALQDQVLAKLVHLLFLACTLAATYGFTRRLTGSNVAAAVAVSLVLSNPVVQFEGVLANVDLAIAFFFLYGFIALERRAEQPRGASVLVAGMCSGLAAASKLSGLFVLVALVPVLWLRRGHETTWREAAATRLKDSVAMAALTLLVALPWYVKSYAWTGDPWYPVLYPVLGGVEWSSDLHRTFMASHKNTGMGRTPIDYLLLPVRVVMSSAWGYDRFRPALSRTWAFWLPVAVVACRRSPTVVGALVASAVYFALWAATSQQTRFLIPILPLLAFACTGGLWLPSLQARGAGGPSSPRRLPGWLVATVLVAVQAAMLWEGRVAARQAVAAARSIFVEHRTGKDDAMNETERFIAAQLPPGARLVLLNTNQGFFIQRDYVSDSVFEASQINELLWRDPSVNGIGRTFAALRVTHVVWFNRDWGIAYPSALRAFLNDPGRARLLHRSTDGRFRVYELR